MIAEYGSPLAHNNILYALGLVMHERGIRGLFAGVVPRTLWISIGGFVFFGCYEKMKIITISHLYPVE